MAKAETVGTCLAAIRVLVLGSLAALVAWLTVASFGWSYRHDFPLLHYAAWLVDTHGVMPYRDLFEFNMPGTYLIHGVMGTVAGWDPAGVRVLDLVWLAVTSLVVTVALRRFGPLAMGGGAVATALLYLAHGPLMTLQREWILLLPLLGAVALAANHGRSPVWRAATVGALVGLAATVKPHAALALPAFVLHDAFRDASRNASTARRIRSALIPAAVGFLVPVVAVLCWVASYGGLGDFWEILTRYTPLYSDLTGKHRAVPDGERWRWVLKDYLLMPRTWLFLASAVPGFLMATVGEIRPDVRRMAWLFGGLTLTFTAYPLVAGKLWPYHFLPQELFAVLTATLVLSSRPGVSVARSCLSTALVLLVPVGVVLTGALWPERIAPPKKAEEIGAYLAAHLEEGDTVQPLDWTGGAVHGMLLARAPIATRYLYDFHFYHHVSNPEIRAQRKRFLEELEAARPRFVIRVLDRRWPTGEDTAAVFPELETFLNAHYETALRGAGYSILERSVR